MVSGGLQLLVYLLQEIGRPLVTTGHRSCHLRAPLDRRVGTSVLGCGCDVVGCDVARWQFPRSRGCHPVEVEGVRGGHSRDRVYGRGSLHRWHHNLSIGNRAARVERGVLVELLLVGTNRDRLCSQFCLLEGVHNNSVGLVLGDIDSFAGVEAD